MTSEEIDRHRQRLRTQGWTDRDLDEAVRRLGVIALIWLRSLPTVLDTDVGPVDRSVLHKVRALLAKAESTTFAEEAEAFSAKAQELMTRHRIEHLGDTASGVGGRRIWLDRPYVRAKFSLVSAVAAANGCRAVHLTGLDCVHLIGYADDLEATELLFTSLLVQAGRAVVAAGSQQDVRGRSRTRSFRSSFLFGFAWRIGDRLREAAATATAASVAHRDDLLPVLRRRDEEVNAAVEAAFPDLARARTSVGNHEGWGAGVAAADGADLGRGDAIADRRRALPSGG